MCGSVYNSHYPSPFVHSYQAMLAKGFPQPEVDDFLTRHKEVLRPLAGRKTENGRDPGINELMRRASGVLSDQEVDTLDLLIQEYIAARKAILGPTGKVMTPKEHALAEHIVPMARMYKTVGLFGEDGVESLHPQDTAKRQLTRAMRNPEARLRAHMRHMLALQHIKQNGPKKGTRRYFGQKAPADVASVF